MLYRLSVFKSLQNYSLSHQFSGLLGEATFLLLAITEMHRLLVLGSLIISIGLGGLAWSALSVNSLDIAPQVTVKFQ